MSLSSIIAPDRNSSKKHIITLFFYNRSLTIPELSKELNLSVPTVSKLVSELVDEEILTDYGKSESKTGRRPSTYGLNPQSGYFLGIDIKKDHLNLGISNFNGDIVRREFDIPYPWTGAEREELDRIITLVREFVASSGIDSAKVLNACVNIGGRVNSSTGYSHSLFNFDETPLADTLSEALGMNVCIDNDSRAMAYGEYLCGSVKGEKDVLYVNLGWGLGLGIIIKGAVYEGRSGFAGEFGHVYAFDNEILCHCGKKGCLETEVSGMALHRKVTEALSQGKVSCLSRLIE
ncbi:MAG: ROK family transcriptional regulator, partial [Muribaculaceae bacterium]|nr:ROK family transcriptional regulator [Muribaculaceae bacterium]